MRKFSGVPAELPRSQQDATPIHVGAAGRVCAFVCHRLLRETNHDMHFLVRRARTEPSCGARPERSRMGAAETSFSSVQPAGK